jgi:LAO/AO transport system kinase
MLELSGAVDGHESAPPWRPPIVATVATTAEGVPALWDAISAHREYATTTGLLERRRSRRMREELSEIVTRRLEQLAKSVCGESRWNELVEAVLSREVDPWSAADEMIGPVGLAPNEQT